MLERTFQNILSAYHGLTEELAYDPKAPVVKWGVCVGYREPVCVNIEDATIDNDLHLGDASFTKSRWSRFMKRYFRADFTDWIDEAHRRLMRYQNRPFVAAYSLNINIDDEEARKGHNYGGCLSSLQIRVSPRPEVILYSRASQIDKIGFLDLCLIHIVARRLQEHHDNIRGTWAISLGFISAISQIFYAQRFDKPFEGNRLERTMRRISELPEEEIKFGPLIRGRQRMKDLAKFGYIPKSVPVKDLSIGPEVFKGRKKPLTT